MTQRVSTFKQHLAAVLVLVLAGAAHAGVKDAAVLAQRFRPYYKFSVGHWWAEEPCRPCSWQWFAAHGDLWRGQTRLATADQLRTDPGRIVTVPEGNLLTTRHPTGLLKLIPLKSAWAGESWEQVIDTGAGLYAQVEDAGNGRVAIIYWSLFAFNRAPLLGALAGGNHTGDITAVALVYDRTHDRLIRAAFGMHGRLMEVFDLTAPATTTEVELSGHRAEGGTGRMRAQVLHLGRDQTYASGPAYFHPGKPAEVYLVQDPQSARFEHLAVFCEWGSHEPWPSARGYVPLAGAHNGDGISFLPKCVRLIGSFGDPVKAESPLVYFNGYWGRVPKGIAFHRAAFYPEGRRHNHFKIPESAFVDRDLFDGGPLPWPP
jgi:hypothetical protein